MTPKRDDHHICHDRVSWEARPEAKRIRDAVIARNMSRTVHNLLHKDTSPVPVPLYPTMQWVSYSFHEKDDVLDNVNQFIDLLDRANDRRFIKPIELELNMLCIDALQSQIEYVREGLPPTTTYIDLNNNTRREL